MPYLQQDHEICTRSNSRGARNVKQAEPVQRPRRFLAEVADGDDDEARRRGGGSRGTASHANVIHRSPGDLLVSGERVLERCYSPAHQLLLPVPSSSFSLCVAANTLEYSTTGTEASTAPDIGLNWSNFGCNTEWASKFEVLKALYLDTDTVELKTINHR